MKARKITLTNCKGFDFEVEMVFQPADGNGKPLNEWCIDERNTAKMIVYANATELLPLDEECKLIDKIMAAGVGNILNRKGGAQ